MDDKIVSQLVDHLKWIWGEKSYLYQNEFKEQFGERRIQKTEKLGPKNWDKNLMWSLCTRLYYIILYYTSKETPGSMKA